MEFISCYKYYPKFVLKQLCTLIQKFKKENILLCEPYQNANRLTSYFKTKVLDDNFFLCWSHASLQFAFR